MAKLLAQISFPETSLSVEPTEEPSKSLLELLMSMIGIRHEGMVILNARLSTLGDQTRESTNVEFLSPQELCPILSMKKPIQIYTVPDLSHMNGSLAGNIINAGHPCS